MRQEIQPNESVVCQKTGKVFRKIDGKIYQISIEWMPDNFVSFMNPDLCIKRNVRFWYLNIWEQFIYDERVWVKTGDNEAISQDGELVGYDRETEVSKLNLDLLKAINKAVEDNSNFSFDIDKLLIVSKILANQKISFTLKVDGDFCNLTELRK